MPCLAGHFLFLYISSMFFKIGLIAGMGFLISCGQNKSNQANLSNTAAVVNSDSVTTASRPFAMPDSIEIYFYPKPKKKQWYYSTFIKDGNQLRTLMNNVFDKPGIKTECVHDSKMYLYKKGEVYKTVYIATADTCTYFAYAINSQQHFIHMKPDAASLLSLLYKQVKKEKKMHKQL